MTRWTTDRTRETFLNYFKDRGHAVDRKSTRLNSSHRL